MRSFPERAAFIPGCVRTSAAICGLQPRRTTSASRIPRKLSFCRTVRLSVRGERAFWIRFAEVGEVTQAMKREGM